jgi:hypothetical protein
MLFIKKINKVVICAIKNVIPLFLFFFNTVFSILHPLCLEIVKGSLYA